MNYQDKQESANPQSDVEDLTASDNQAAEIKGGAIRIKVYQAPSDPS